MMSSFSCYRFFLIVRKELVLMRRDPASIIIMLVLPITLIILFGFTVHLDPQHIPTALVDHDHSKYSQRLISALENSGYFAIRHQNLNDEEATALMEQNKVQFILTIPQNFSHQLLKNQTPSILIEIDSITPMGISLPLETINHAAAYALNRDLSGSLASLQTKKPRIQVIRHYVYNPHLSSPISIIPNTIGLVLMLSMLMLTNVTSFRDRNEGTFDSLIVSPLMASEIILGGVFAYILVGYLQLTVGLLLSCVLFHIPIMGHVMVIYGAILPYLVAELSLGMLIAVLCDTQLQAVQISNICIAISIVLSGFLFPYWGIPAGVRWISEVIPLTHLLRILHSVMLKGSALSYLTFDVVCLLLFCCCTITLAIYFYRHRIQRS